MKSQLQYCRHLGQWFYQQQWHFTTLLSVMIEVSENLPADADALINELLLACPEKPSLPGLVRFLENSSTVGAWFTASSSAPRIIKFCLQPAAQHRPPQAQLPTLATVNDLADWLEISAEQLEWLADLKRYDVRSPEHFRHYHYSVQPKRSGQMRLIESPKSLLKAAQRRILHDILPAAPVHNAAHGFRKNRSCRSHAVIHQAREYLFVFDLAHCFQSIRWMQVYLVFVRLAYPAQICRYLTALCTHSAYSGHRLLKMLGRDQAERLRQRHLAQGAPSSPALSNAVLFSLDRRLSALARSLDLSYSRYADDLAFSGDRHRDWRFFSPLVAAICLQEGFVLNHHKSRCLRAHQRQLLTGIVVNQKINIERRSFDRLKAELHNCIRSGPQNQNRGGVQDYRAHLAGRVQYVGSLNESRGRKLQAMFNRIAWPAASVDQQT